MKDEARNPLRYFGFLAFLFLVPRFEETPLDPPVHGGKANRHFGFLAFGIFGFSLRGHRRILRHVPHVS